MKKIAVIAIMSIVFLSLAVTNSYTNDSQPPAGRTGASIGSTETTCGASTCHNNTPNTGGGSVTITYSDSNLKYVNGQTYDMTVSTDEVGKVKFGFEITVVDANGDSVGKLILPNGSNTVSAPANGAVNHRKYLAHKNASSTKSWSFQWKAPVTDRGNLTFFASSNCANGTGTSSGDHIYTTSLTISHDFGTGILDASVTSDAFNIQSISNGELNIHYSLSNSEKVTINLFDMNGRLIQTLLDENGTFGNYNSSFKLDKSLSNGIYLVDYRTGNIQTAKKFIYQN
jgi:hypothetical protein